MNFDQRKAEAKRLVFSFLSDFTVPRGMTSDQQASRIIGIADAFARRMPTRGDYTEACERVLDKIRDTHLSNSWPAQAVFVMAMPQTEAMQPKAAETFRPDEWELAAQKMGDGQPVPERYIWGPTSDALVNKRLVTVQCRDRYRKGSIEAHREVYGIDAWKIMERNFGSEVRQYAPVAAE